MVSSYISAMECRASHLCCGSLKGWQTLRPLVISQTSQTIQAWEPGRLILTISKFFLQKFTLILPGLWVKGSSGSWLQLYLLFKLIHFPFLKPKYWLLMDNLLPDLWHNYEFLPRNLAFLFWRYLFFNSPFLSLVRSVNLSWMARFFIHLEFKQILSYLNVQGKSHLLPSQDASHKLPVE